ncbi:MAG: hypothetical protein AB8F34_12110 [Akkermansiaceae bacterium]
MNDINIYQLIQYVWLIIPVLFLFGSVKLHKANSYWGGRLLIIGFGLLTVHSIMTFAQYLEIFEINYHPMNESRGTSAAWVSPDENSTPDKWLFWLIHALSNAGYLIAAVGFFAVSRRARSYHHRKTFTPSIQNL